jgi:DNA polymerase elongation subunit (family B)
LPIEPDASINAEQRAQLREYCRNDLEMTAILYNHLKPQIDLRVTMGELYRVDLRSMSDAQIAEVVIGSEIERLGGCAQRPVIKKGYTFRYKDPGFITFVGADLNAMFQRVLETDFGLSANGSVEMPEWLKRQRITIGKAQYQMGIGGLHSCEKRQFIQAGSNEILADWDVASYYPNIILGQRLSPAHLGEDFLTVFQSIVKRRLDAKRKGDKVTADVLKIVINGTFGKLGSMYSFLYSPDLMAQTTITGQLALLMLIERMEIAGIKVVSANTDGIVLHGPKALDVKMQCVAWDWMLDTSYELERTNYSAIASRDVNSYVAVMLNGKTKGKGVFATMGLAKNPDCQIVYDAVAARIANGTPIERTIRKCDDIRRFVTVRRVTGGALWRGENIGKAIRYYYATSVKSEETINYIKNGNKVPMSEGTRPLMQLPDAFPTDVDYDVYLVAAERLLCEVGYL